MDMNDDFAPGRVVDGYTMTHDGTWVPAVTPGRPAAQAAPAGSAPPAAPSPGLAVEAEVDRRMADSKTTAWLLWLFLGAFNAHLAYIYPKQGVWIALGSVVLFLITFGLSGFAWFFSWAFLLRGQAFDLRRDKIRLDVEREFAYRSAVYGH